MLKKWQQRYGSLASKFNLFGKLKEGKLTADEQKMLTTEYEKVYGISFEEDKKANEDAEPEPDPLALSEDEQKNLAEILGTDEPPKDKKEAIDNLSNKVEVQKIENDNQKKVIDALAEKPEDKKPVDVVEAASMINAKSIIKVLGHAAHTEKNLFGIENPFYARGKWYNELMVTLEAKHKEESELTSADTKEFRKEVEAFSDQLKKRVDHLKKNNMLHLLDFNKLAVGNGAIDYTDLFNTAGEYIVRRSDLILAFLRSLPSVDDFFPMVSNVQNKEIVPGANFGELSQGYRKGKLYKGRVRDKKGQDKLHKSLDQFGLVETPVINLDNHIIAGERRWEAYKESGRENEMIDVRVPSRMLTREEVKTYMLISNTHAGKWDLPKAEKGLTSTLQKEYQQRTNTFNQYATSLGTALGDVLSGQKTALEAFGNSMIDILFDVLTNIINTKITEATAVAVAEQAKAATIALAMPDSVATFGASGAARAAAMGALIMGALQAAKTALKGMISKKSGSSSSSATTETVTGKRVTKSWQAYGTTTPSRFADGGHNDAGVTGGYSGDGPRYQIKGRFSNGNYFDAGEYIVAQPEMKLPVVASHIQAIESIRRKRTNKNPLPKRFADGGFNSDNETMSFMGMDNEIAEKLISALEYFRKNKIQAEVNYYNLETTQNTVNSARKGAFKK